MKFLCDRCKTRYSIGDDRVRGKILKIRCKNCANVITVREGMPDADAAAPDPSRRKSPTTNAPMAQSIAASQGALSAAFSAQMAKPPPALEEEWYVSIDGDQSGPFSLAEAQRWVAGKPYDAELHCWSEGFDDWLAVDKVSHFRGLRKKPAPAPAPPPLPRVSPRLQPVPASPPPVEDDPKPLFAATMAVLEKGSGPARVPATASSAPSAPLSSGGSAPGKTNGSTMPVSAKGYGGKAATPAPVASANKSGPARSSTVQGVGSSMTPGAKALAAAFDVAEEEAGDSMTAVQAAPFPDEMPRPEPFAAKRAFEPAPAAKSSGVPEDDGLEIGEVSRVVNLADITRGMNQNAPRKTTGRSPQLRGTGSAARISAAEIPPGVAAAIGAMPAPLGLGQPIPSESIVAAAPVAASRRGVIILLVAAGVLLAGVLAAVMLIFNSGDDDDTQLGSLHQAREIDTSRPEDIVRKIVTQATGSNAATITHAGPGRRWTPGQRITTGPTQEETTDPTKRELEADEVEDMATKQSDGTAFCYKRAQRGAIGIEIQDLKRLDVVLTVDKTGTVQKVDLSSHATDQLGLCLASRIRGWKFRESSGTKSFKITLVFSRA